MKIFYHPSDLRSLLFVAASLGLAAVQWNGWWRHPALYIASLCLAFIACVIDHNHQHRNVFIPHWLNKVFGVMLTWAIGQPATAIIPMHMRNHHVHNNHDEDFVRTSIVGFRWNLLNLLLFPFLAIHGYAQIKSRDLRAWSRVQPKLYRQLVLERWALYPLTLTLLIVSPIDTLIFLIVPWLYGQWGILAVNHLQHDGCDPDSDLNHARNFTGRWLNWWTFNNGFHTAHHLRPSLHWSRLPALHTELQSQLDPGLQESSLIAAFVRFYIWPGLRPTFEKGSS